MQAVADLLSPSQTEVLQKKAGMKAFSWIDLEFPSFDLFRGNSSITPDQPGQTAFCELALLIWTLKERWPDRMDEQAGHWADCLAQAYRHPSFHQYMLNGHPLAFTGHLIVWSALEAFGKELPISRNDIQKRIDEGLVTAVPRQVYRTVELKYFLDRGGFRHTLPDNETLFQQSFLSRLDKGLDDIGEEDIYHATHLILYMTDMGRTYPSFWSDEQMELCRQFCLYCLTETLEYHHWDLVAELLLVLPYLGAASAPIMIEGWQALAAAQDMNGAIPEGPDGTILAVAKDQPLRREHFLALYHRTLTLFLAACPGLLSGGL